MNIYCTDCYWCIYSKNHCLIGVWIYRELSNRVSSWSVSQCTCLKYTGWSVYTATLSTLTARHKTINGPTIKIIRVIEIIWCLKLFLKYVIGPRILILQILFINWTRSSCYVHLCSSWSVIVALSRPSNINLERICIISNTTSLARHYILAASIAGRNVWQINCSRARHCHLIIATILVDST